MQRATIGVAAAAALAAVALGIPTLAGAQTVAPIDHRDVSAECAPGHLLLTAQEVQHLPAGTSVVVTDTVSESGTARELSSATIRVDVRVDAVVTLPAQPIWFRPLGDGPAAAFVVERTTDVHAGSPSDPGTLVHTETMTITCSGTGPATVSITTGPAPEPPTTTTTTTAPAPTPTPDPSPGAGGDGDDRPAPASPVRTTARYTG